MKNTITYVLDSNIITYFLKNTHDIDKKIFKAVSNGDKINVAPIAYYEVKRGLQAINATKKLNIFEDFCIDFKVGELDKESLSVAANIHCDLKKKGKIIEDADILVAAYCVANNYTLVSHNTKHFKEVKGLQYVDWVNTTE